MRHAVAEVMGTTVTIDVRDAGVDSGLLERSIEVLRADEARFSTYRADSEISRIDRGEVSMQDVHPDVREVLAACAVLRAESDGAFDAARDGHLDPSGYVKGWSAERAASVLRAAGVRNFTLNVGGDVICSGGREPGAPWRVGVRDPDDAGRIVLAIAVRDRAVATSGTYERGAHIVDARTGKAATRWRSITVLAPDLASADAIATAALAIGEHGPTWAAQRPGCEVAAIGADGSLFTTSGIESARIA